MTDLAIKDPAVLDLFKQNAGVGTEDMGGVGELPILKLTTSMSQDNILANGDPSRVGMFYYKPLKKEYREVKATILYIRKAELPDFTNKEIKKMTYIVGGLFTTDEDGELPFILFVKGFSLQNMWDFQKDLSPIVSSKTMPVPMLALKVTIKTTKRSHPKFKSVDTIAFVIERDNKGHLVVETDSDRLNSLIGMVAKSKELIDIVMAQSNGTNEDSPYEDQANTPVKVGDVEDIDTSKIADEIPF